jgi:hypothetical protein
MKLSNVGGLHSYQVDTFVYVLFFVNLTMMTG